MNNIHKTLILMMKEIDLVFIRNNIPYSIGCGTALGQVRNKSIIEWDDDIDLIIEKKDYDKAIKKLREELSSSFHIQFSDIDKKHHMPMAKVFYLKKEFNFSKNEFWNKKLIDKLSIDLFRIIRTNKTKRPIMFGFWTMWFYIKNANYGKVINFLKFPFFIFSNNFIMKKKQNIIKKIEDKKGKRFIMDEGINPNCYPYIDISKTERVKLNNIEVNFFKENNEYLKNHYGNNYMVPKKYNHKISEK